MTAPVMGPNSGHAAAEKNKSSGSFQVGQGFLMVLSKERRWDDVRTSAAAY